MALEFKDFETTVDGKTWYGTYEDRSSYRCYGYDGDIGSGGGMSIIRFETAEGRTYWKQAEQLRQQASRLAAELEAAERELKELSTLRGAWRNLLRVIRERGLR